MRQFQCTSTSTHANYHSHSIATHYSTTHRFDAPVPLHKVCQHMQNTKARHQQRREKSHGTRSYNKRAFRARFHGKAATPKTVARVSQLFSATEPLFTPKNTQCFVQIQTLKSHPWCSSSTAICQQRLANHNQNPNFSALDYFSLLYLSRLYSNSTPTQLLLYLYIYLYPYSTSTQPCSTALCSALRYSAPLYSSLVFSALLFSTLLYFYLYSSLL